MITFSTWSSASFRQDGRMQLGSHGLPLGIMAGDPFSTDYEPATKFCLAEGDVMVMLVDGFHEWARAGDGEQAGIERL